MGGTTTFIGGVAPFYGPLRNGLNDLQNGRVASGVKNLGLAALDFSLIRSAFQLATKGVAWASGKAAGQAGSKLAAEAAVEGTEAANAAAHAANAQKMAAVRQLGHEGEEAANIAKNTERIPSLSGKVAYRIPDELTETMLKEVKNVAELSFDSQIQDSLHYAMETGRDFVLVVRAGNGTHLTPQLQRAVDAGWIILEHLP